MADLGLTHLTLPVRNTGASIAFYAKYAHMQLIHRRIDPATNSDVTWLSDRTRPFVIVLRRTSQEVNSQASRGHIGVACASREEVDRLCAHARAEGCLLRGPSEKGYPGGYSALLSDPDGYTLELSFGQEIA